MADDSGDRHKLMLEFVGNISSLSLDLSLDISPIIEGGKVVGDVSPRTQAKNSCRLDLSQLHKDQRQTGRITELFDLEIQFKSKKLQTHPICCCINPYIDEEPTVYFPGFERFYPTDVWQHRAELKYERIFFNLCSFSNIEFVSSMQRATDGVVYPVDMNLDGYTLVKTEKCSHRHHDLRRYSTMGRLLTHLCTGRGLLSTVRKCCCMDMWEDHVAVETVRCERQLYRQSIHIDTRKLSQ